MFSNGQMLAFSCGFTECLLLISPKDPCRFPFCVINRSALLRLLWPYSSQNWGLGAGVIVPHTTPKVQVELPQRADYRPKFAGIWLAIIIDFLCDLSIGCHGNGVIAQLKRCHGDLEPTRLSRILRSGRPHLPAVVMATDEQHVMESSGLPPLNLPIL